MFQFLNTKYKDLTGFDLDPKKFILDNEAAVYKNLKEIYPQTPIGLCRVHLMRSWRKKAISIFSKPTFENNCVLKEVWQILKGVFYIPTVSFPILVDSQFDDFFLYLEKNYLGA